MDNVQKPTKLYLVYYALESGALMPSGQYEREEEVTDYLSQDGEPVADYHVHLVEREGVEPDNDKIIQEWVGDEWLQSHQPCIVCALCGRTKTIDPRVHTNWRTLTLNETDYHICTRHFPPDGSSEKTFKRAYDLVLRKIIAEIKKPLTEQEAFALAAAAMTDKHPLTIKIPIMEAWTLVAALQMTTRHPGIGESLRQRIEQIARQFQGAITNVHPEVAEVIEAGWNPAQDVK